MGTLPRKARVRWQVLGSTHVMPRDTRFFNRSTWDAIRSFTLTGTSMATKVRVVAGVGWESLGVRVNGLLPYLLEEFFEALEPVEDVVLLVVGVAPAGGREDVDLGSTNEFGAGAGGGTRSEAVGVG